MCTRFEINDVPDAAGESKGVIRLSPALAVFPSLLLYSLPRNLRQNC